MKGRVEIILFLITTLIPGLSLFGTTVVDVINLCSPKYVKVLKRLEGTLSLLIFQPSESFQS